MWGMFKFLQSLRFKAKILQFKLIRQFESQGKKMMLFELRYYRAGNLFHQCYQPQLVMSKSTKIYVLSCGLSNENLFS